jgi:hypothetical protein
MHRQYWKKNPAHKGTPEVARCRIRPEALLGHGHVLHNKLRRQSSLQISEHQSRVTVFATLSTTLKIWQKIFLRP